MQGSGGLRSTDEGLAKLAENLLKFNEVACLPTTLLWIKTSFSPCFLLSTLKDNNAKYHHNCASNYNDQKVQRLIDRISKQKSVNSLENSSPGSSGVLTRPKRKSTNDIFPIECVFCEEGEKDLSKLSKKQKALKNCMLLASFIHHLRTLMLNMLRN